MRLKLALTLLFPSASRVPGLQAFTTMSILLDKKKKKKDVNWLLAVRKGRKVKHP